MFSAVDKGNTTLLVIAMNAVWDRESVDSFVNNRKRDWKDYGFKRVAFVYTKGTGKKMTLETYAVFNIKQS